jgi:hypothetical protein
MDDRSFDIAPGGDIVPVRRRLRKLAGDGNARNKLYNLNQHDNQHYADQFH